MEPSYTTVTAFLPPTSHDDHINWGEVIGGIILAIWILFSNLTLIIAILRSEHRRTVSFNLHVCNLCLTSLLMGGLVLPFYIDHSLKNGWEYSENFCRIWLMGDLMVCTASILVVAMMLFDRFVLFSCPEAAEGGCKYVFTATLIILPWVLAAGFIIPIYLFGETGEGVKEDNNVCYLHLKELYAIVLEIGGYAVPGLTAFALLVATSLTWCVKREELRDMDYSEEREHKGWQVFASWIICLAVLGMWFPFSILHVLTFLLDKTWPREWLMCTVWIAYANAGFNPILWMIKPRLRWSVWNLFCSCRHNDDIEDDFQDDDASEAMIEIREKNV